MPLSARLLPPRGPLRVSFSTCQLGGWLGWVFQPLRSVPLKSDTKSSELLPPPVDFSEDVAGEVGAGATATGRLSRRISVLLPSGQGTLRARTRTTPQRITAAPPAPASSQ